WPEAHFRRCWDPDVDEHAPAAVGLLPPDGEVVAVMRLLIRRFVIDERARTREPTDLPTRRDVTKPRFPQQLMNREGTRGLLEQTGARRRRVVGAWARRGR